ncbi:hypothetical protein QZH41_001681 [Actinostola sp. cb2023]|nr:hypothetical protein QZH41_001681 [Actinostola sp. cb2023]
METVRNTDFIEFMKQQRPNTKHILDFVTNVTFYVTKLHGHPIGRSSELPAYILNNKAIVALVCDGNSGVAYQDALCFFRCLAVFNGCHRKNLKAATDTYFLRYSAQYPDSRFKGVKLEELTDLEKLFNINIVVYSLEPHHSTQEDDDDDDENSEQPIEGDVVAHIVRRSHRHYPETMYLNLYKDHFSFIKNVSRYSKSYQCSRCSKYWKDVGRLHRHEVKCEAKTRLRFPGAAYVVPPTIFEKLGDEGIDIPEELRYFKYFATFDFESMLDRENLPENSKKLKWENMHVPLSFSICSNVPGYQEPKCSITNGDSHELLKEFNNYLLKISEESYRLLLNDFETIFTAIDEQIGDPMETDGEDNIQELAELLVNLQEGRESDERGVNVLESDDEDEEEIESENEEDRIFLDDDSVTTETEPDFYRALDQEMEMLDGGEIEREAAQGEVNKEQEKKKKPHPLVKLKMELEAHLKELPVLGFNNGRYDLNVVKEFLLPYMVKYEPIKFAIKKNNNTMCLKTEHLKFLDITNYLAPGFSYDQFIKAYEVHQTKGFLPYEWIDSLEKLNCQELPPHATFFSYLKNKNITEEEYQYCQRVWKENGMETFREFLVWYNNLDVAPFVEAVEKMMVFWQERKIDMFKDGVSVPGLTLKYLFNGLNDKTYFNLFNEKKQRSLPSVQKQQHRRAKHHLHAVSRNGVPESLKEKFSEMCPIFKNIEISREDIGEYMKEFAEENDMMKQPRRSLIGSMHGEKILLATPLLKWYLAHGLEVTRIYQVVEFTPEPCFSSFGVAVSNARRAGDVDPSKAIIADTMKLVGNSSYDKTITNQLKHREVRFSDKLLVASSYGVLSEDIGSEDIGLPVYAKLRMLEFYYDFMDTFVDRSDFQYLEMDTDSAYIAISGESLEEVVRPELREKFQEEKHLWLPRDDTAENLAYDKRTPGLFKGIIFRLVTVGIKEFPMLFFGKVKRTPMRSSSIVRVHVGHKRSWVVFDVGR